MANFDNFFEKLSLRYGLEYFGVFYGRYRGTVTRNDDPEKRGRIQARVPAVGHRSGLNVWIDPTTRYAGGTFGEFYPPELGSLVWVSFENGDPARPTTYSGGWYPENAVPSELRYSDSGRPERRGIVTRMGHMLLFCDEKDSESIRMVWHKPDPADASLTDFAKASDRSKGKFSLLSFEPDGSVQIANASGSRIDLSFSDKMVMVTSEQGNSITLDKDGIKVIDKAGNIVSLEGGNVTVIATDTAHVVAPKINLKGGGVLVGDQAQQSAILGEIFKGFFDTHTHPTGVGPSGVPTVPLPSVALSQTVKVKA